jgi:hypothetical protein
MRNGVGGRTDRAPALIRPHAVQPVSQARGRARGADPPAPGARRTALAAGPLATLRPPLQS